MDIKNLGDYDVVIVGDNNTPWLESAVKERCLYINKDSDPEQAKVLLGDKEYSGPFAVVSNKGADNGNTCAVSSIGESVIVHCQHDIIPVKDET